MLDRIPNLRTILPGLLTLLVFSLAMWLLYHEFHAIKVADVAESFRAMSGWSIAAAVLLTAANYAVLVGYDWLGIQLIQRPLSFRKVAMTALITYAVSNTLGAILGGTAVRARMYSIWGLTVSEIARLIFYISLTFWMGLFVLGGTLFLVTPFDIPPRFNLPLTDSRPLGGLVLACAIIYYATCIVRKRPFSLFGLTLYPPTLRLTIAQTLVAGADFVLASAALYVLLPPDADVPFLRFTAIFLLAIIVALVTHIPGGLGVLELVLVTMLDVTSHSLVASLLAFRVIYYLLPLLLATVAVAGVTVRQHGSKAKGIARTMLTWSKAVSPRVITAAVFVSGLVLLVSGALPAAEGRLQLLRRAMPLPVIEVSHFVGSIVGALLLILARALQRRIDAAWVVTILLLGCGIAASLLKGFDYEEAVILTILLAAMLPCRSHFNRRGRLLAASPTMGWTMLIVMGLTMLVWVMFFAYRHVEYSHDMWWKFALQGDAPRSLRALLGVAAVLGLYSIATLFQPHPKVPSLASPEEMAVAETIVKDATATIANLALLGDKRFVFSEDRKALVMFGCEGRTWIAMGDPIGPRESGDDAAWRFREACDQEGVWPAFYQVDEECLGRYVDMGMNLVKLGEEAHVPLTHFSLNGASRKDLRRALKRGADANWRFEIASRQRVDTLLPALKKVSDSWLANKPTAEKGFSLGRFKPDYLRRFDVALVYRDEALLAFANILRGAGQQELSVDLMRYLPESPHGLMEYLFVQLLVYGQQQGYQRFNLGMAPLSGVDEHRLASWWNHASNFLYRHGEHFYNFQGLRRYKEKFDPIWVPKYLASPGGINLPVILGNVASLIAGGRAGLTGK